MLQTFYLTLVQEFVKGTVGALSALVEGFLVTGGNRCLVCRVLYVWGYRDDLLEILPQPKWHSMPSLLTCNTELAGFFFSEMGCFRILSFSFSLGFGVAPV